MILPHELIAHMYRFEGGIVFYSNFTGLPGEAGFKVWILSLYKCFEALATASLCDA